MLVIESRKETYENAAYTSASLHTKGKAEFVNFSFDVKFEGKNVCRAFDLMLHNDKNTPPFPVLQGPAVAVATARPVCLICDKAM